MTTVEKGLHSFVGIQELVGPFDCDEGVYEQVRTGSIVATEVTYQRSMNPYREHL